MGAEVIWFQQQYTGYNVSKSNSNHIRNKSKGNFVEKKKFIAN